jgi:hypothetical protein
VIGALTPSSLVQQRVARPVNLMSQLGLLQRALVGTCIWQLVMATQALAAR